MTHHDAWSALLSMALPTCAFMAWMARSATGKDFSTTATSSIDTCFDARISCVPSSICFRNRVWAGYKTSEGIEPALLAQFHPLEEAIAAMGVAVWPMTELEADDALASAARICRGSRYPIEESIDTPLRLRLSNTTAHSFVTHPEPASHKACPPAWVWQRMLVWIADTGMQQAGLERLAAKLGRPARNLAAFGELTPQELVALNQLIDEACQREREALRAGSPQLLPVPLRRLFLGLLGWREP